MKVDLFSPNKEKRAIYKPVYLGDWFPQGSQAGPEVARSFNTATSVQPRVTSLGCCSEPYKYDLFLHISYCEKVWEVLL